MRKSRRCKSANFIDHQEGEGGVLEENTCTLSLQMVVLMTALNSGKDWSLIMGRGGGGSKTGGAHVKIYPYEKGVNGKSFSRAKGRGDGTKCLG